jgi:hypothetical protein
MARQYAPLHTEIWNDETFVALTAPAQRLYLLAISQPNISWTGTVPYTARRWANLASGTTAKQITAAASELAKSGLVMLDENTEELWVRSFIKYNAAAQPKLREAAKREYRGIHSPRIRAAALRTYSWLAQEDEHPDGHPHGQADGQTNVVPDEPSELRVGVGVHVPDEVKEKSSFTQNTNTNTELEAWITNEAERQADAWVARGSIVDRDGWIAKRIETLAAQYDSVPEQAKRHLRIVCANPNCRRGFDLGGNEPVPCSMCEEAAASA